MSHDKVTMWYPWSPTLHVAEHCRQGTVHPSNSTMLAPSAAHPLTADITGSQ